MTVCVDGFCVLKDTLIDALNYIAASCAVQCLELLLYHYIAYLLISHDKKETVLMLLF